MAHSRHQCQSSNNLIDTIQKRVEAVQFILEQNPDIDCQDGDGRSAVYLCAQNEYSKCLKLLINHRVKFNLANSKGVMSVVIDEWIQIIKYIFL